MQFIMCTIHVANITKYEGSKREKKKKNRHILFYNDDVNRINVGKKRLYSLMDFS